MKSGVTQDHLIRSIHVGASAPTRRSISSSTEFGGIKSSSVMPSDSSVAVFPHSGHVTASLNARWPIRMYSHCRHRTRSTFSSIAFLSARRNSTSRTSIAESAGIRSPTKGAPNISSEIPRNQTSGHGISPAKPMLTQNMNRNVPIALARMDDFAPRSRLTRSSAVRTVRL